MSSTPLPVAILIAGDPIDSVRKSRGTYADLIRRAAGRAASRSFVDVDIRAGAELAPPEQFSGIVVTGSSSSVTDREGWVLAGEEYLRRAVAARVPVFGICFGHQMLGQALGGRVARNPRGREIGTVDLEIVEKDPILEAARAPFRVNATHVDTIVELPPGATVLARTRLEQYAAVRFSGSAWGVQFHPEMDAAVARAYLEARRNLVAAEGSDPAALLARVDDAQAGASTLERFFAMAISP
jgi:GMP synthase (glutamine-hydrolysing)